MCFFVQESILSRVEARVKSVGELREVNKSDRGARFRIVPHDKHKPSVVPPSDEVATQSD